MLPACVNRLTQSGPKGAGRNSNCESTQLAAQSREPTPGNVTSLRWKPMQAEIHLEDGYLLLSNSIGLYWIESNSTSQANFDAIRLYEGSFKVSPQHLLLLNSIQLYHRDATSKY